ncbi:DUF559 domain-containing protein [Caldifermentibacillus hisashii]|uniref:DUF559 domain-containing protein n=1 Tax=Caldifermentibacillus hisashii TaxID=996558 RepID=UPI002DFD4269|nr:DUF559 domain-containing protein [Caldifermentibacillus hisashii]
MRTYSPREKQKCIICGIEMNNNKAGQFTKHLVTLHQIDLPTYLKKFFYKKENLICQREGCGNLVEIDTNHNKNRWKPMKYCSNYSCRYTKKNRNRKCLVCNNLFSNEDLRVKTCSKECSLNLKSKKVTEWHANMSEKEKRERFEKIISKTAATRRKNKTPSWNSGKTGIYTEETIEKIRKAALIQFENGVFRKTSIESKVEELLQEMNLKYKYSFILQKHQFDFLLIDYNILIECDGDYWHVNPKFYPKPKGWQIKRIEIDKEKNRIAKNNGYTILRFWEDEINNNLGYVHQIISSHVASEPQRNWKQ